jgi:hypothetical protein
MSRRYADQGNRPTVSRKLPIALDKTNTTRPPSGMQFLNKNADKTAATTHETDNAE